MFIIIPIFFMVACALWFWYCIARAGRGIAARIIFAILGLLLFILIQGVIPKIMSRQAFIQLLNTYGDPNVAVGIFITSAVIVFLVGLLLRRMLKKTPEKGT
jgi:hypothetical protein